MLLNQHQASHVGCPQLIAAHIAAGNPIDWPADQIPPQLACQGTRCMYWRWNPGQRRDYLPAQEGETALVVGPHVPIGWEWSEGDDELPMGWHEPEVDFIERKVGFCGTAVRPFED